jgi:hypothetical protein
VDNPIRDMVDNILSNKEADALNNFETAIADKMHDALEIRKQEIASSLGESDLTDKFNKAADFIGDLFTGELGRKAAEKMMQKKDEKKDEKPAQQPPQKK